MNWTMIVGGVVLVFISCVALVGYIGYREFKTRDLFGFLVGVIIFLVGVYAIVKGVFPRSLAF